MPTSTDGLCPLDCCICVVWIDSVTRAARSVWSSSCSKRGSRHSSPFQAGRGGDPWGRHGGVMGASWGRHGGVMGASWGRMGASWGHGGVMGASSSVMGASFMGASGVMGASWGRHGGVMGASWGRHGGVMGASWSPKIYFGTVSKNGRLISPVQIWHLYCHPAVVYGGMPDTSTVLGPNIRLLQTALRRPADRVCIVARIQSSSIHGPPAWLKPRAGMTSCWTTPVQFHCPHTGPAGASVRGDMPSAGGGAAACRIYRTRPPAACPSGMPGTCTATCRARPGRSSSRRGSESQCNGPRWTPHSRP